MAERTPNGEEHDDDRAGGSDAERLEADWERALAAASDALSANTGARTLSPQDVSAEEEHIRAERKWLSEITPTLRKLFPGRHEEPSG